MLPNYNDWKLSIAEACEATIVSASNYNPELNKVRCAVCVHRSFYFDGELLEVEILHTFDWSTLLIDPYKVAKVIIDNFVEKYKQKTGNL